MKGRLVAWGSVGGLVAASTVVAVLSVRSASGQVLFPAPPPTDPVAAARLARAVTALLDAPSFTAHVSETLSNSPDPAIDQRASVEAATYTYVFQAPDRAEVIGPDAARGVWAINIGRTQYTNEGTGPATAPPVWTETTSSRDVGAPTAFYFIAVLMHPSSVVPVGRSRYRATYVGFVHGPNWLRIGEQQEVVTATVADGHVSTETIEGRNSAFADREVITYGRIGAAPAVEAPPADEIQPPCSSPRSGPATAPWCSAPGAGHRSAAGPVSGP